MTAPVCPLCRRPSWDGTPSESTGMCLVAGMIARDRIDALTVRDELLDCRTRALSIAALVAPVAEAIDAWASEDWITTFDAVDRALDAMRAGLAKLQGGS